MRKILSIFLVIMMSFPVFSNLMANADADVNLALNKDYFIEYESPIENAFPKKEILTDGKDEDMKLTDGEFANDGNSSEWLKLFRGTTVYVTIDLEEICSIKEVNVGRWQHKGPGILSARYINVEVSEDGEKFNEVGSLIDNESVTIPDDVVNGKTVGRKIPKSVILDKYYKARYVRVSFSSDVHTYIDEIVILGKADASGISAPATQPKVYPNSFMSNVDGITNTLLVYTGEYYKSIPNTTGKINETRMLPFVAYLDNGKKVVDTMFESLLFLPLSPLESNDTKEENKYMSFATKTGYEAYLNATIGLEENINITALNKVIGDNKEAMGLADDYKYPIYISVPFLHYDEDTVFGTIDGKQLKANSFESRDKINKWFIELIFSKFNDAKFEHVQINGLYWHEELVQFVKSTHEEALMKSFNDYVHDKGYSTTWIPYYCAPGFENWKEYGFDAAVLQSGYAFEHTPAAAAELGDKLPGVIADCINQAKKHGLGMEFEISGLGDEAIERFMKYIESAVKLGVMDDGLMMMYQAGDPGVLYYACNSSNQNQRNVYDLVYKYIKKQIAFSAPVIEPDQFIIVPKGLNSHGQINITNTETKTFTKEIIEPKNVKISIDSSGYLNVESKTDFIGEDSFSLKISDNFSSSEMVEIKIIVVDNAVTTRSINTKLSNKSMIYYQKTDTFTQNTTGTDERAYEVVIENNKVVKVGGNNNTIPENGFVVAASGEENQNKIKYLEVGMEIMMDNISNTFTVISGYNNNGNQESEVSKEANNDIAKYAVYALAGVAVAGGLAVLTAFLLKGKKKNKDAK